MATKKPLVLSDGTICELAAGDALATGGGSGSAVIDFGAFPGSNESSVAVTGQSAILATSAADAVWMVESTADHTDSDHAYASLFIVLICTVPSPGVGFTINARSQDKMQGTYKVRWNWR
ncbi:MAG: hypothetical protein Q8O38_16945 [Sulfurimicrobium sp.]|nr:hypothetical protein [Sulfurimicrobium sp.]